MEIIVHFTRFRLELFSPHAPERKSLSLSTSENALGGLATSLVFAASRKKTAEPLSIILGTHLPLRAASSRRRISFDDGIIELALIATHMLLPEECVRMSLAHSCGNYKIRQVPVVLDTSCEQKLFPPRLCKIYSILRDESS